MSGLFAWLATAEIPPAPQRLGPWWESTRRVREQFPQPFARAAASALYADRLGWAFAAGYQAALASLFPTLGLHQAAALCATEATGARPRDIKTTLTAQSDGFALDGEKLFTTAAELADWLLVVASAGPGEDGRPHLKVVRVNPKAAGVTLSPMAELPFVPEIPHASVKFAGVQVARADVLEGDGYEKYLKPFRTLEDLHVNAALLGYLMGVARRFDWPRAAQEELLAHVATGAALADMPAASAETHLVLAGFLAAVKRSIESFAPHFEKVEPDERRRWERDRALLQVAERLRAQRLERAWERIKP